MGYYNVDVYPQTISNPRLGGQQAQAFLYYMSDGSRIVVAEFASLQYAQWVKDALNEYCDIRMASGQIAKPTSLHVGDLFKISIPTTEAYLNRQQLNQLESQQAVSADEPSIQPEAEPELLPLEPNGDDSRPLSS